MTILEMYKAVLQKLNVIDGNFKIDSEDVELALNDAIDIFIKERFDSRDTGFEQSQIRIDDLRDIIKESGEIDTLEVSVPFENNLFIDKGSLPEDYMFLIHVSAKVNYNADGVTYTLSDGKRVVDGTQGQEYNTGNVRCSFSQLDDIQEVMRDPFSKTKVSRPIYTVNDNNIYIYTDNTFIVDKIYLTYIRQPAKVSLASSTNCDLAVSTHRDIVDIAVRLLATQKGTKEVSE